MKIEKAFSGGEKVFITGVSGFIGSRIAHRLSDEGFHVAGLIQENPHTPETVENLRNKVDFYTGDLRDYSGLSAIVRNFSPDAIIHLGAITPVSYSFDHPQEVTEVNYKGTINLAEAARNKVPHLQKFLFSSSMEVYGNQDKQEPFTEEFTPRPNCPYAVAKLASEKYLRYLSETYDFPAASLRQTNCYGRKHNKYFVVEAFITQMLEETEEVNFGNPDPYRNFLHIEDLVDLYVDLLHTDTDKIRGEVYNTGPANALQIRDLASKIADLTGFDGKINWRTREMREGEVYYLNSSNDKIEDDMGWTPKVSLEEGLKSSVDYWRQEIED